MEFAQYVGTKPRPTNTTEPKSAFHVEPFSAVYLPREKCPKSTLAIVYQPKLVNVKLTSNPDIYVAIVATKNVV